MNAFPTLTLALAVTAWSAPALPAQQLSQFESLDRLVGPDIGSRFGETFVQLSDLNLDGVPEFAVGSPGHFVAPGLATGRITVYSGATRQVQLVVDATVGVDSLLGLTLDLVGDFDHDGHPDMLVGAGGLVPAYIVSSATGLRLQQLVTNSNGQVGMRATVIGDVNADGFPEFVLGLPTETVNGLSGAGRAIVYDGTSAQPMYTLKGESAFDNVGELMLGPGDLNGDGIPDLLIGLPSRDNRGLTAINGATGQEIFHLKHGELGMKVSDLAVTGDLNQDGIMDFLATGYRYNDAPQQWVKGVAKIFSGADGSVLRTHAGFQFEDFGRRAEAIGDVNGDGSPDIGLVATPLNRSWTVRPTIIIISGQDGQEIGRWQGPAHGGLVLTLGALGDTNQDGRDDFLVGVPQDWFSQSTYFGQTQVVTFLK